MFTTLPFPYLLFLPIQIALVLATINSRISLEIFKEFYNLNFFAVDVCRHNEVSHTNCVIVVSLYSVVVLLILFSSLIAIGSTSTPISSIHNSVEIKHPCLIPLLILTNSVWNPLLHNLLVICTVFDYTFKT